MESDVVPGSAKNDDNKRGKTPRMDLSSERFRWSFEDPMYSYLQNQKMKDKSDRRVSLNRYLNILVSLLESSKTDMNSPTNRKKNSSIEGHSCIVQYQFII
ncbi:uncharacterized protein LOC127844612 isoform X2 [Dreissena polymorpha]|uniref:uncharacterized protein LOC127844612 isoform X2 n=1 Tax=Dreissena polymorpha TaxID=45954 RepID=UPI0022651C44|nr:uncharacterized protein LOC127844612 isoform X2 [Dreissena polymorpha]